MPQYSTHREQCAARLVRRRSTGRGDTVAAACSTLQCRQAAAGRVPTPSRLQGRRRAVMEGWEEGANVGRLPTPSTSPGCVVLNPDLDWPTREVTTRGAGSSRQVAFAANLMPGHCVLEDLIDACVEGATTQLDSATKTSVVCALRNNIRYHKSQHALSKAPSGTSYAEKLASLPSNIHQPTTLICQLAMDIAHALEGNPLLNDPFPVSSPFYLKVLHHGAIASALIFLQLQHCSKNPAGGR
ncbi:hypothetical protein JCM8547_000051 [Rhodosporidiobolus lusitaniae]